MNASIRDSKPMRSPVSGHWLRRIGVGTGTCLALLLVLSSLGAIYQRLASARDKRLNPPPGLLIDVGGYRMHLHCTGQGSPTVILDSGLSDSSLSWYKVQPEIAQFTRVCAYDRAGLGWSDPSPRPRDSKVFAEELHTLLQNAGVAPPFILVGHSMGGFDVRIYASQYRSQVAGMLLVDSPDPDLAHRLPELRTSLAGWSRQFERQRYLMPLGIPRILGWCGSGPPEMQSKLRRTECTMHRIQETLAECQSMWGPSASEARSSGSLGNIPLVVLSEDPAKNVKAFLPEFERGQEELMHLSSNSSRMIALGSGHQIQRERPDSVVSATRAVIRMAAESQPR